MNVTFLEYSPLATTIWIGDDVLILSLAPVTIESSVCISQRAFLCTGTHNHHLATFDLKTKPITIRAGCWVAARRLSARGVEVSGGSIISAGGIHGKRAGAFVCARQSGGHRADTRPSSGLSPSPPQGANAFWRSVLTLRIQKEGADTQKGLMSRFYFDSI